MPPDKQFKLINVSFCPTLFFNTTILSDVKQMSNLNNQFGLVQVEAVTLFVPVFVF
jgi:hypothetical protein